MLIDRTVLAAVAALFLMYGSLAGQEAAKEQILPEFPGEKLEKSEKPADPEELVKAAAEKLGGAEAFGRLKDLTFKFKHKHYLKKDILHSIELATGYLRFEDPLKQRYDFENYSNPSDLQTFFDYREILGSEGPFKYLEGRILRAPLAVREAGERLYRNYMIQCLPFCLNDLKGATLEYVGRTSWTDKNDQVECHKILIHGLEKGARIVDNVMAIYIDDKHLLRRIVYLPRMSTASGNKVQVLDFMERVTVAGLDLPNHLVMSTYTKDNREAIHMIWFSEYRENTGLEGVGFELFDQEE